jgi:hypothetical protein
MADVRVLGESVKCGMHYVDENFNFEYKMAKRMWKQHGGSG